MPIPQDAIVMGRSSHRIDYHRVMGLAGWHRSSGDLNVRTLGQEDEL